MARVLKAHQFHHGELERIGGDVGPREVLPDPAALDAASAIVGDAQAQAEEILTAARAEAEALVESGRQSALQAELDAYEQGKLEGFAAGRAEGMSAMERIVTIAEHASVEWENAVQALEQQIVDLAVAVAQRVVSRIAETDQQMVLTSIMQALDHLADSQTVTIRVNPADEPLVSQHWAETRGRTYRDRIWEIVADRGIEPGGCILELESGIIDAQVSTQLTEIRQSMLAAGGYDAGAA